MGLFAPWFLAGLVGLAVPLYLHLLRRQTTTPKPVSSLMLFESRTQSSIRHRRLRYFLLLSLRLLLLLLLILAFRQSLHQPQRGHSCQQPPGTAGDRQLLQHACRNALDRCQGRG
jgi:hypothetical protein